MRHSRKIKQIGVTGVRENGAFIVRAILDGSPAASEGIRVGDRLLTVNGRPFTTVGSFESSDADQFNLVVERPGAGKLTLKVTPATEGAQESFLRATRESIRVIQQDAYKIGYIHLWCM